MELEISKFELDVLKDFLAEAQEHLDGIEERILDLENSMDMELVNSIFRPAHTIKGSAAFLGLNDIQFLAHEMETLLDDLRKERISVSSDLTDTLLACVDTLSQMLRETSENLEQADESTDPVVFSLPDISVQEAVDAIRALKAGAEGADDSEQSQSSPVQPESGRLPVLTSDELKALEYPPGMKEQFLEEGKEYAESIERELLNMEKTEDKAESINSIFRSLHTLKGNSGVILSVITSPEIEQRHPLTAFKEITHAAENMMQLYRDNAGMEFDEKTTDLLLEVVDLLKRILDDFENDRPLEVDVASLLSRLSGDDRQNIVPGKGDSVEDKASTSIQDDAAGAAFINSFTQSCEAIEAGLLEVADDNMRDNALKKMLRGLQTIEKSSEKMNFPELVSSAQDAINIVYFLMNGKDENEDLFIEELKEKFAFIKKRGDGICASAAAEQEKKKEESRDAGSDKGKHNKAVSARKTGASHSSHGSVIKVSQEKLDKLMNLVGELIVSKNNFHPLAREIAVNYNLSDAAKKVKAAGDMVSRISDELQATVMSIRMLPVSTVFARFPRMIRDLSKKMSKHINLVISGEETELDKTIIEAIGDPLVHLVRNSVDHGLESPDARIAAGKPETGTIHLKAYNQGQNVIIDIIDDGKGIDANLIRAKALEKGIISTDDLERLDDRAAVNLIFAPGFSTAEQVTEVSGRGVGMDVVRTNIEGIGGSVQIKSIVGVGTTVSIKLPLTLAVSQGLEVASDSEHYFLPLDYVLETVRISPDMVHMHRQERMVVVRDVLLPIKKLSDALNMHRTEKIESNKKEQEISLVILNINGRKLALEVDRFYNESEFVIKSLEGPFAEISGLSGATVTGEGRVILVLDPLSLF